MAVSKDRKAAVKKFVRGIYFTEKTVKPFLESRRIVGIVLPVSKPVLDPHCLWNCLSRYQRKNTG
jgi:hypothetical protein